VEIFLFATKVIHNPRCYPNTEKEKNKTKKIFVRKKINVNHRINIEKNKHF